MIYLFICDSIAQNIDKNIEQIIIRILEVLDTYDIQRVGIRLLLELSLNLLYNASMLRHRQFANSCRKTKLRNNKGSYALLFVEGISFYCFD